MGANYNVDASGNEIISGQFKTNSTTRGSLASPRLNQTEINAISSPVIGEQVFNTTINAIQSFNGSSFVSDGALTINQIGFGSPSNLVTGDPNFVWDSTNKEMSILGSIGGIYLPTSGGNPSVLGYYEETFTINATFSGPWGASTFSNPLTFSRVGNMVTMQWPGFTGQPITTPQTIRSDLVLPPRFAPETINNLEFVVKVYYGASAVDTVAGTFTLEPIGGPNIYANFSTINSDVFSSGYCGITRGAVSWIVFNMV